MKYCKLSTAIIAFAAGTCISQKFGAEIPSGFLEYLPVYTFLQVLVVVPIHLLNDKPENKNAV